MKLRVHILLIYLIALTVLPSARAIKMQFGNTCEMSCHKNDDSECENGKFVMSLNFSPVQFVKEVSFPSVIFLIPLKEKTITFYRNFFVSNYFSNIWHPPKFLL